MMRNCKRGTRVRVSASTQHRDRIGRVVGLGEQTFDMVGPVERLWVDFPYDNAGPYLYDDNDLEPP
jgi:hypothetical protein